MKNLLLVYSLPTLASVGVHTDCLYLTPLIHTTTLPFGHQTPPAFIHESHDIAHVSRGMSVALQYLWSRPVIRNDTGANTAHIHRFRTWLMDVGGLVRYNQNEASHSSVIHNVAFLSQ